MDELYQVAATRIDGKTVHFSDFQDKVLLIVNVASRCGYTPQYRGLEWLHREYGEQGLVVLGFPCNQFAAQEPEDEAAIKSFCETTYDVTFPLFAKVEVNGANCHPLFRLLKSRAPGLFGTETIKWNFTKFLVGRDGKARRYAPKWSPQHLYPHIERALKAPRR